MDTGLKLYLMIGYPGAGKSTVANFIQDQTGAVHLMADQERHKMFSDPTHSAQESLALYNELNERTDELLSEGRSVVFDTNFNFYTDRQKLREIASKYGAETIVIWVVISKDIARNRAVRTEYIRNGYSATMSEERFDHIVEKLEPPTEDEKVIKIDGTKLDRNQVIALLKQ